MRQFLFIEDRDVAEDVAYTSLGAGDDDGLVFVGVRLGGIAGCRLLELVSSGGDFGIGNRGPVDRGPLLGGCLGKGKDCSKRCTGNDFHEGKVLRKGKPGGAA